MARLFKRIYIATILEAGMLVVLLYSIPAEVTSQLILGRSIYRWVLILPALILTLLGLILLPVLITNHRADIFIKKLQTHVATSTEAFGDYLVFWNLLYVGLFFLSVFCLGKEEGSTFVRLLPWWIFAIVVVAQIDYFFYRLLRETELSLDLKSSFVNLPSTFRNIFLKSRGSYVREDKRTIFLLRVVCTITLISAFLLVGYYTITFAQLNSDEAWYLYAAKQVYQGQRPYQDFAFTQMPLLPYIYGVGLLVWKSMYAGRLISFLIFCASLLLVYLISKKTFKTESFLWILLLFTVYPDGFYFNSIVKTYALTFFFFLLSFYVWASSTNAEVKYPILFILLLLGTFTRITFAFYAVVVGMISILEIWNLKNRGRIYLITLAACLPFLGWSASFFYPYPALPLWNIYRYNAAIHGMGFSADALTNFFPHLRGFLRYARPFRFLGIPLLLSLLASAYYRSLIQAKNRRLFLAALAGLSFICLHFFGEGPLLEYYVPAIMFLVVLSVWFLFSFTEATSIINHLILWVSRFTLGFIVIALILAGKFGIANYNLYQGHPPIRTVQEIANVVNHYAPGQPIFALEGLYVAVEANRQVFPGLSMAQFSIVDMSTKEVGEIHLVNTAMVADLLRSPNTKILILTEKEIAALDQSINNFEMILETNYRNVFEIGHFGQKSVKAYVFIRK
jgi:hypothetical protein